MYQKAIEVLTINGFEHYEISNFAKPKMRSKHNSSYWSGSHYLGVGSGAHSYNGISRQWNVCNINQYCSLNDYFEVEHLLEVDVYNELIITNLRRLEGVDLEFLCQKFGDKYYSHCEKSAQRYLQNGLLEIQFIPSCITGLDMVYYYGKGRGMPILNVLRRDLYVHDPISF